MKYSDIHIRAISQEMPQPSITKIHLKITYLKFYSNFPGANELKVLSCLLYCYENCFVYCLTIIEDWTDCHADSCHSLRHWCYISQCDHLSVSVTIMSIYLEAVIATTLMEQFHSCLSSRCNDLSLSVSFYGVCFLLVCPTAHYPPVLFQRG